VSAHRENIDLDGPTSAGAWDPAGSGCR
jgi:hypothetical protein